MKILNINENNELYSAYNNSVYSVADNYNVILLIYDIIV